MTSKIFLNLLSNEVKNILFYKMDADVFPKKGKAKHTQDTS